jgi:hypothetical protein
MPKTNERGAASTTLKKTGKTLVTDRAGQRPWAVEKVGD